VKNLLVIKNGIPDITPRTLTYTKGDPIKLIYHSTPWRGLNVLLAAMQMIKNPLDYLRCVFLYTDLWRSI
jgi:hypothetical protein